MIEREQECARLSAALADGGLVLIEGPAGSGRSLLLEHTRREARERGMTVFAARAGELEQAFAFGVVRQLFERELLGASAQRRAELLAGAAALAAPAVGLDDGAAPRWSTRRSRSCTASTGSWPTSPSERPCCSSIDDAHWADAASLRALAYLAARLEGLPVDDRGRGALRRRPRGRCSTSSRSPRATCCGPRR